MDTGSGKKDQMEILKTTDKNIWKRGTRSLSKDLCRLLSMPDGRERFPWTPFTSQDKSWDSCVTAELSTWGKLRRSNSVALYQLSAGLIILKEALWLTRGNHHITWVRTRPYHGRRGFQINPTFTVVIMTWMLVMNTIFWYSMTWTSEYYCLTATMNPSTIIIF